MFSKNLPKHLNTLKGWIDEFVEKLVKVTRVFSDEAYVLFEKLGITVKKVPQQPILASGVPIPIGDNLYALVKDGKEFFRGTKKEVDELVKKLDELSDVDAKKYLDELTEIKKLNIHYNDLDRFRKTNKLPKYDLYNGKTGTTAKIEIKDKSFYGVNSTFDPDSINLRRKWFDKISWVPPKKKQPKHLGHAQALTHAEAHSLMNAFEKHGKLPSKINMYVDRPTCNMCKGELPVLMKAMGIEELIIFSGKKKTLLKLIINF